VKPLKLTVQAFGPFPDREVLDFTDLGGRTLLLIHGETGAGKTTLVDAICFALYGETSGGERTPEQMRSDHAAPDMPTEVIFEFELRGEIYRATRSPRFLRLRKKGKGDPVPEPPRALLEKLRSPGADTAEAVLAKRCEDVTEQATALLGMGSQQFLQVVVLPQGKFRDFLSAKNDDREKVLETLFPTPLYRKIQAGLASRAKVLEDAVRDIGTRRTTLLESVQAQSEEELDQRRSDLGEQVSKIQRQTSALDGLQGTPKRS